MYTNFFGFNQKPFNLTPDPQFYYLGENQKKSLAHLLYGISNRKGFIALTGEVGAGKTTLCRLLLKELDTDVSVAVILNSLVDQVTLLKQINRDFGISYTSDTPDILIGALNDFLISEKKAGRNVLVIVDECQNLKFDVLEQIRMLSNLETEKDKLLQILLIGQPEFLEMLQTHELRQLNSRITVRAHVAALSENEIETYIYHRLKVAGNGAAVRFTKGAIRKIASFSKGIPRGINVICDYALLAAYVESTHTISARMVHKAIHDIEKERPSVKTRGATKMMEGNQSSIKWWAVSLAACFFLTLVMFRQPIQTGFADISLFLRSASMQMQQPIESPLAPSATPLVVTATPVLLEEESESLMTVSPPAPEVSVPVQVESVSAPQAEPVVEEEESVPEPEERVEKIPEPKSVTPVVQPVARQAPAGSPKARRYFEQLEVREQAVWLLLSSWGISIEHARRDSQGRPLTLEGQLERYQFALYHTWANLELIQQINLPCAVRLASEEGEYFVVVDAIRKNKLRLHTGPGTKQIVSKEAFLQAWQGDALILAEKGEGTISPEAILYRGQESREVAQLKNILAGLGYTTLGGDLFDLELENIIKGYQSDFGLTTDGIVGVETKLLLYSQSNKNIPRLQVENSN